jgi:hypothetical protein
VARSANRIRAVSGVAWRREGLESAVGPIPDIQARRGNRQTMTLAVCPKQTLRWGKNRPDDRDGVPTIDYGSLGRERARICLRSLGRKANGPRSSQALLLQKNSPVLQFAEDFTPSPDARKAANGEADPIVGGVHDFG